LTSCSTKTAPAMPATTCWPAGSTSVTTARKPASASRAAVARPIPDAPARHERRPCLHAQMLSARWAGSYPPRLDGEGSRPGRFVGGRSKRRCLKCALRSAVGRRRRAARHGAVRSLGCPCMAMWSHRRWQRTWQPSSRRAQCRAAGRSGRHLREGRRFRSVQAVWITLPGTLGQSCWTRRLSAGRAPVGRSAARLGGVSASCREARGAPARSGLPGLSQVLMPSSRRQPGANARTLAGPLSSRPRARTRRLRR
jgi:hypothetical protein